MKERRTYGRRHRRPDRHWALLGGLILDFLWMTAVILGAIIIAELLCTAVGCPVDPWEMR